MRTPLPSLLAGLALLTMGCRNDATTTVEGTGTLEAIEVDVAATTGGRVVRVLVDEGDVVAVGDTLAVLTIPTLAADRAQRAARVAAARAALREAEHGPLPREIDRATAELAAQTAEAERTAADVRRLTPLAANDMATAQQLDAAHAAAAVAAGHRDAAAAQVRLLRDGTRAERLEALRAELTLAEAALAATDATARDLILTAPVAGRVIARRAEPGEVLAAGERAVVLAETMRQWVRIYMGRIASRSCAPGRSPRRRSTPFPTAPSPGPCGASRRARSSRRVSR